MLPSPHSPGVKAGARRATLSSPQGTSHTSSEGLTPLDVASPDSLFSAGKSHWFLHFSLPRPPTPQELFVPWRGTEVRTMRSGDPGGKISTKGRGLGRSGGVRVTSAASLRLWGRSAPSPTQALRSRPLRRGHGRVKPINT